MSDDNNGLDAPKQQTGDSGSADFDTSDISSLPIAWQNEIKKVRSEAAQRRKELADLKKKVDAEEVERLKKQGEYQSLAERLQTEVQNLTPHRDRVVALEEILKATNATRVKRIPEHLQSFVPDMTPENLSKWLDANETKLTTPPAPNLNAGAGGGGGGGNIASQLTAEELAIAKQSGLTPEQYAKQKK